MNSQPLIDTGICENQFLLRKPLSCRPAAETALQPKTWCSERLYSNVICFPEGCFFTDTGMSHTDVLEPELSPGGKRKSTSFSRRLRFATVSLEDPPPVGCDILVSSPRKRPRMNRGRFSIGLVKF